MKTKTPKPKVVISQRNAMTGKISVKDNTNLNTIDKVDLSLLPPSTETTVPGTIKNPGAFTRPKIEEIDKLITPIPGSEFKGEFVLAGEGVVRPEFNHPSNTDQGAEGTLSKGDLIQRPEILVTPIPDRLNIQKDFEPVQVSVENLRINGRIEILTPLPEQSLFDMEQEIRWAPFEFENERFNRLSYTVKFWEESNQTLGPQQFALSQPFATVSSTKNAVLPRLLNVSQFTPGKRYVLQVLASSIVTSQVLASSTLVPFFYTPILTGPVFLQTKLIPIQLVIQEEKDPVSGKERKVYYFFRNGKWFRIVDPKRKHPKDPHGIDIRDGIKDPNFTAAPADINAELNKRFFPTGWEKNWQQFEESSRVQLQILAQIGLKMQGVDPESIALMQTIREELAAGESVGSIWETHQTKILLIILGLIASAAVGAILGKLFRLIFRKKWLKALTDVDPGEDIIKIRVKDGLKAIKDKRNGLDGAIAGIVQKEAERLYCPPAITTFVNTSGKTGAVTDLFLEWIKILKAYAKEKGLKEVHIVRTASSSDGVKLLKRLGFKPTAGNKSLKGIGDWERTLPVK